MRATQQFSITLPTEMANVVKSKVADGEYASESEVRFASWASITVGRPLSLIYPEV